MTTSKTLLGIGLGALSLGAVGMTIGYFLTRQKKRSDDDSGSGSKVDYSEESDPTGLQALRQKLLQHDMTTDKTEETPGQPEKTELEDPAPESEESSQPDDSSQPDNNDTPSVEELNESQTENTNEFEN